MTASFQNIAILLAGGEGKRVGGDIPKQLRTLPDGRTVLQTCIDTFRLCPAIDDIWVVMHRDWLSYVPAGVHAIEGGKERWESSFRAIQAICEHYQEDVNVWIHDAARPFVSQRILADIAAALENHDAVTVAVPVTDTLYRTEDGHVREIPDRKDFMRGQTPQAFHLGTIAEAFRKAMEEGQIAATDDVGIVHRYMPDVPVFIVPGEERNRKITYQEDFKP